MPGDKILLSHGEGGKRTRELIRKVIAKRFDNPVLSPLFDSGLLGQIGRASCRERVS
jgi:hydrogenase maturation factor